MNCKPAEVTTQWKSRRKKLLRTWRIIFSPTWKKDIPKIGNSLLFFCLFVVDVTLQAFGQILQIRNLTFGFIVDVVICNWWTGFSGSAKFSLTGWRMISAFWCRSRTSASSFPTTNVAFTLTDFRPSVDRSSISWPRSNRRFHKCLFRPLSKTFIWK